MTSWAPVTSYRAPGDVTGLPPFPAAEPHRDTDAAAGATRGHDVTHCGR